MKTGDLSITGMRGVGAIIVMLYHYRFLMPNVAEIDAYLGGFVTGLHTLLDFFFIVSGFIISFAYARMFEERVTWAASVKYFAARLGRLYPLHIALLLPLVLVEGAALAAYLAGAIETDVVPFDRERADLFSLVTNLLMIHSWNVHDSLTWNLPSWTISAEMAAYIVFVLLFFLPKTLRPVAKIVILGISCAILFDVMKAHGDLNVSYDYGIIRVLAGFMVGSLIYDIAATGKVESDRAMAVGQVVGYALFFAVLYFEWNELVSLIAFGMITWGLRSNAGPVGSLLNNKPIVYLGEISYSVYMVHYVIFIISERFGGFMRSMDVPVLAQLYSVEDPNMTMLRIALMVVASVGISHLTYKYIEMPYRNSFKQIGQRLSGQPVK